MVSSMQTRIVNKPADLQLERMCVTGRTHTRCFLIIRLLLVQSSNAVECACYKSSWHFISSPINVLSRRIDNSGVGERERVFVYWQTDDLVEVSFVPFG